MFTLVISAMQVADHFGDRDQITRVDFLFIFLRPARPHGPLYLGFALKRLHRLADHIRRAERAQARLGRFVGRHPQRHLVFFKRDDEQLKRESGNVLLFDRDDLTDTMGRVHNIVVGAEFKLFRLRHSGISSVSGRGRDNKTHRSAPRLARTGGFDIKKSELQSTHTYGVHPHVSHHSANEYITKMRHTKVLAKPGPLTLFCAAHYDVLRMHTLYAKGESLNHLRRVRRQSISQACLLRHRAPRDPAWGLSWSR